MEHGITAITSDFGSEDSSSILDAPTNVYTKLINYAIINEINT